MQEHPSIPYCGRIDPFNPCPYQPGTLSSFGLPVEPVFIILGIDELMDMARTATNVLGNCLATVVIARWEGEFQETPEVAPAAV